MNTSLYCYARDNKIRCCDPLNKTKFLCNAGIIHCPRLILQCWAASFFHALWRLVPSICHMRHLPLLVLSASHFTPYFSPLHTYLPHSLRSVLNKSDTRKERKEYGKSGQRTTKARCCCVRGNKTSSCAISTSGPLRASSNEVRLGAIR